MASRICWHCGVKAHMKKQTGPAVTSDSQRWYMLFHCDNCGYPSIGMILNDFSDVDFPEANLSPDNSFDDPAFEYRITWIPQKAIGKEYEDVPKDIASAASEAYACFSVNANRAAVLLARTTVEAVAKEHEIKTGSLRDKIEEMAEKNIITGQLKDEAHEIRMLGNDMAHGDLGTPVTEDDASDILGFLDTLLDYVYQQPMAIQKRRELRAKRKEQASD